MSLEQAVSLPVVIPLAAAGLSIVARSIAVRRALGLAASTAYAVVAVVLLLGADREGAIVLEIGGWEAPFGIALVADRLSTLMLAVAAIALLAVLVYAVGQDTNDRHFPAFHGVYQVLAAGVALAFLTGDLFTLFVAFEVMLMASYVLITHRAGRAQVQATITYVVIGIVASGLFLVAVALAYALTGTVNMADMALALEDVDGATASALGWLLFLVFGIKAAIFPLFFWLPDSYPTAPAPITAIFAGLLTKVGVYAMIRTQTLLFPEREPSELMLVFAGLTMLAGVLGAIAQADIKRILSFHIVSQIGYMVMGLGFFTAAGIAAAIVFIVHQIVVKTTLFLVGGLVETSEGSEVLGTVSGVLHRAPVIAALFMPAALSLAGLPPFSGFVGKLALVEAGFGAGAWAVVGVSLLVSILTMFSMTKIWGGVFWGAPSPGRARALPPVMTAATASLVVVSLGLAVLGQPLLELSTRAADDLLSRIPYVEAVLGA
jgi:multicomponent Na+:H+ antiporter subunit D